MKTDFHPDEARAPVAGAHPPVSNDGTAATANHPADGALPSRRAFLSGAGVTVATVGLVGTVPALVTATPAEASNSHTGLNARQRRRDAFEVRLEAAKQQFWQPLPRFQQNGDEARYPNRIGSYSKGLPHKPNGEVDPAAYDALLKAAATGKAADFAKIPKGGTAKLVNPQASLAFHPEGADAHSCDMPPPPAFATPRLAAQAIELYWQALCRDVSFDKYATDGLIDQAASELGQFADALGVPADVTSETLFRGESEGDLIGPYVSQFLLQPIPFGATRVDQRYNVPLPGQAFLTDPALLLAALRGQLQTAYTLDATPRYLRNGRDLGEWVHKDFPDQGFSVAVLILLGYGAAALADSNPYKTSNNQAGFVTFGSVFARSMMGRACESVMKATWFHKWLVHRLLRPEAFGLRVQHKMLNTANYPIHASLLNSEALRTTYNTYGSYVLPQGFPEGSPLHPSYPAGHAAISGACASVLKALFKEDFPIPNPVVPSADGTQLVPYVGPTLTVGNELDKLASNIAMGRNFAGIHWRSDSIEGIRLGELAAIRLLEDCRDLHNEPFEGFSFTSYDGEGVDIS